MKILKNWAASAATVAGLLASLALHAGAQTV